MTKDRFWLPISLFVLATLQGYGQANSLDNASLGQLYMGTQYVQFDTSHLTHNTTTLLDVGGMLIPIHRAKTIYVTGLTFTGDDSVNFGDGVVLHKKKDSLATFVQEMVKNSPNCDQVLIAYSQGGLRAIAYANVMARLGFGNRIKGIIFVDSPVRGFPALSWGATHLQTLVDGVSTSLSNEFFQLFEDDASLIDNPVFIITDSVSHLSDLANEWQSQGTDLVTSFAAAVVAGIVPQFSLISATNLSSDALESLSPQSQFDEYWVGTTGGASYYCPGSFTVGRAVALFYKPTIGGVGGAGTFPVLPGDTNGDFSYDFTKSQGQPVPCIPVLPTYIHTAFIVDTNNDPSYLVAGTTLAKTALAQSELQELSALNSEASGYVNVPFLSTQAQSVVSDTNILIQEITAGYISQAGSILGDLSNDGFIPLFAQSRPQSEIGGTPIDGDTPSMFNASHYDPVNTEDSCLYKSAIWGGGGFGSAISDYNAGGGYIPKLYDEMINSTTNLTFTFGDRAAWAIAKRSTINNMNSEIWAN